MGGRRSGWWCRAGAPGVRRRCWRHAAARATEAEKATIASLSLALAAAAAAPIRPTDTPTIRPAGRLRRDAVLRAADEHATASSPAATCHLIDRQFQDDHAARARPVGIDQPPLHAARGRRLGPVVLFWDGRRDSLWAQALTPLEDPREHGGTRAFYAHFVAENFKRSLRAHIWPAARPGRTVPANAGPLGDEAEKAAWAADAGREAGATSIASAPILASPSPRSNARSHPRRRASTVSPKRLGSGKDPEGRCGADDLRRSTV